MITYFDADITWIDFKLGGRNTIPKQGTRYCPLLRIDINGICMDWSIDFICPDSAKSSKIRFRFLVDNAPSYLVKVNDIYYLYEGKKKVAEVKILSYSDEC